MGQILDLNCRGSNANWFTEMGDYERQQVTEWVLDQFNIDLFERAIYRITFHMLDAPFIVVYEYALDAKGHLIPTRAIDEKGNWHHVVEELKPQTLLVTSDWPEVVRFMAKVDDDR